MALLSILFGGCLVGVGLVGYYEPSMLGSGEPQAQTALIPAAFGAVLVLLGLLSIAMPKSRKHAMHLAMVVALVGAVGGVMPLQRNDFDFSKAAVVAGALLIGIMVLFVVLGVRSFIVARTSR